MERTCHPYFNEENKSTFKAKKKDMQSGFLVTGPSEEHSHAEAESVSTLEY